MPMHTSLMRRPATAILATSLFLGSLGTALAQPAPAASANGATTPIAELGRGGPVTVRGEIVEIFGDSAIIRDATGRTLVEFGDRLRGTTIAVGQTVTVEGRADDGKIERAALAGQGGQRDATADRDRDRDRERGPERDRERGERGERGDHGREENRRGAAAADLATVTAAVEREGFRDVRIVEVDDDEVEVRATDAEGRLWEMEVTPSGIIVQRELEREAVDMPRLTRAVEEAGFTGARILDTKKRHAEVQARDAEGREWELHVGFDGDIRKRERIMSPMAPEAIRDALQRAGYTFEGSFETKKKHVEAIATNDRGERVEVHLDTDGGIRKEERIF